MRVFLALPSYDQRYWGNTLMSVLHCGPVRTQSKLAMPNGKPLQDELQADTISGSLLPRVFNEALGKAVCRGFQRLVMLHADIAAEPGWLTKMIALSEMHDADVLSACVGMKDKRNLTSTAIQMADAPYRRMLTWDECSRCTQTFSVHDAYLQEQRATGLLLNTGLMVMRLDRPWLKKWSGFQILSRIHWQDNGCQVDTLGEDWDMSEQLTELGCKLMATTAVQTHHWGVEVYGRPVGEQTCKVQAVGV